MAIKHNIFGKRLIKVLKLLKIVLVNIKLILVV